MLSSILRSKRAVQVNFQIMRAFNQHPRMLVTHKGLKRKIEAMEKKYDEQFRIVFEAITQLIEEDEKPKKKIGYMKRSAVTPRRGGMLSEIATKPGFQSSANL